MMLKVQREPYDSCSPLEWCCICLQPTAYWLLIKGRVTGNSPALCQSCAKSNDQAPTKEAWFELIRERYGR